jgi:hypothetical protein
MILDVITITGKREKNNERETLLKKNCVDLGRGLILSQSTSAGGLPPLRTVK